MTVEIYDDAILEGTTVIRRTGRAEIVERWPVDWLSVGIDGTQHLIAALDPEGQTVHQAFWTASPIVSYAMLAYQEGEFNFSGLCNALEKAQSMEEVSAAIKEWTQRGGQMNTPGYKALIERFGKYH